MTSSLPPEFTTLQRLAQHASEAVLLLSGGRVLYANLAAQRANPALANLAAANPTPGPLPHPHLAHRRALAHVHPEDRAALWQALTRLEPDATAELPAFRVQSGRAGEWRAVSGQVGRFGDRPGTPGLWLHLRLPQQSVTPRSRLCTAWRFAARPCCPSESGNG